MDEQQNIIIYRTADGVVRLDVRLEDKTVWLTIDQMAELQASHALPLMSIFFIYTRKEIRRNDVKIAKNCLSADELKKSS